jgi:hypothetical protein
LHQRCTERFRERGSDGIPDHARPFLAVAKEDKFIRKTLQSSALTQGYRSIFDGMAEASASEAVEPSGNRTGR